MTPHFNAIDYKCYTIAGTSYTYYAKTASEALSRHLRKHHGYRGVIHYLYKNINSEVHTYNNDHCRLTDKDKKLLIEVKKVEKVNNE